MRRVEGDSFEDQWKDAMEEVELSPPDHLWTAIDGELANAEAVYLKKQLFIYRGIAASLLLLVFSAFLYEWTFSQASDTENQIVLSDKVDHPEINSYIITDFSADFKRSQSIVNKQKDVSIDKLKSAITQRKSKVPTNEVLANSGFPKTINVDQSERSFRNIEIVSIFSKSINQKDRIAPVIQNQEDYYFQKAPVYNFHLKDQKMIASNSSDWADLNIKGGVFEPNFERNSNSISNVSDFRARTKDNIINQSRGLVNNSPSGEDLTAGYSYTVNVNYGKKITPRIFLSTGLEYGQYEAVTSTNKVLYDGGEARVAVTEQIITDGDYKLLSNSIGVGFENVELNNSFQFASIPFSVGYVIFNKKLSLSLNGGVSTSFYLGNTLKDPDQALASVSVTRGENTIYRDVNFSAVGGLSLGYKFFNNYEFTLQPVYQRALNSYTRETSDFTALPENFGLSAGIRLFFK